jgi:4-diphosphocytidyl-2-C-methyl-D-erythritol kinase
MLIHAPAKLNLCLYLGPPRDDGLHELCSLFEPLALGDLITLPTLTTPGGGQSRMGAEPDEVICPEVEGENLVAQALAALRERGWDAPPLRVEIEKRIPVAAGLGGGSADAAAILRLAAGDVAGLDEIALELGADVPSQLTPALALVQGGGEKIEHLPEPAPHAVVLLPDGGGLSTAAVFAEADRLGLGRDATELDELAQQLRDAAGAGASPLAYPELLVNDLEPAARSLRPRIGDALEALRAAGAPHALLTGSGPTVFGLFEDLAAAHAAVDKLDREDAIVCEAGYERVGNERDSRS